MRILVGLLLLLSAFSVEAQTARATDGFDGADALLDAGANWTKVGGAGGSELQVLSNELALDNTAGARRLYTYTDQGESDMYVSSDLAGTLANRGGKTNTQIAIRALDQNNYIGIGMGSGGTAECGIRVAGSWTPYNSTLQASATAVKVEGEGSEIRCFYKLSGTWTRFHTQTGVTTFQTETNGGYISNLNSPDTVVWDNFEIGDFDAADCDGLCAVIDIFDLDDDGDVDDDDRTLALAAGTTYYFDSSASGSSNGSGISPANAFYTANQVDSKSFTAGDALLLIEDQASTFLEKIKNDSMVGTASDPFFVGVYHMVEGSPVVGFSGGPYSNTPGGRPCTDGFDYDSYDYWSMDMADILNMEPPVNTSGSNMTDGSLEGLWNWYQNSDYTLNLWVQGLCIRATGGRAIRFTQTGSAFATGLLVEDFYTEGTMTQAIHVAGVRNALFRDGFLTLSDAEQNHGTAPGNRQAHVANKGAGDPTIPTNVIFQRLAIWDSLSSECINSNSGGRQVAIIDVVCVDSGKVAGLYLDRTYDYTVLGNMIVRTGRTAFHEWDGATTDGRDAHGIMVQDEAACGSFDWCVTYSTAQDFLDFASQRMMIAFNVSIGWEHNYGLLSQESTKASNDTNHMGDPHAAGVYMLFNTSLDPAADHFNIQAGRPSDYVLRTDIPPSFRGNLFWTGTTQNNSTNITDRNDNQFVSVFTDNYRDSDITGRLAFDQNETTSGVVMPLTDYFDLSVYMTTDGDDHMDYDNFRSFLTWMGYDPDDLSSKDLARFRPIANADSGLTTSALALPPGNTWPDTLTDIEGETLSGTLNFGAFSTVTSAVDGSLLMKRRRTGQ